MPRWRPDASARLQAAALELFAAQGYERTTVAEIAGRAGLTERTFFNHFPDKRAVLFGRTSERHREAVALGIAAAPPDASPLETALHGLRTAADEVLEEHREAAPTRRALLEATPELREREEGKRVVLATTIAQALVEQGVAPDRARRVAGTALLIQQEAEIRWEEPGQGERLSDHLAAALSALREELR